MAKIAVFEGSLDRYKKRRSRGGGGQRSRFRTAAKKCKGLKIRSFRACMRQHLKG